MGYRIRVLSPSDEVVPHSALKADLVAEHPRATLSIEDGSDAQWEQLILRHPDGAEIAVVERNSNAGGLVNEEIDEFIEEVSSCQPQSSVDWLAAGSHARHCAAYRARIEAA